MMKTKYVINIKSVDLDENMNEIEHTDLLIKQSLIVDNFMINNDLIKTLKEHLVKTANGCIDRLFMSNEEVEMFRKIVIANQKKEVE